MTFIVSSSLQTSRRIPACTRRRYHVRRTGSSQPGKKKHSNLPYTWFNLPGQVSEDVEQRRTVRVQVASRDSLGMARVWSRWSLGPPNKHVWGINGGAGWSQQRRQWRKYDKPSSSGRQLSALGVNKVLRTGWGCWRHWTTLARHDGGHEMWDSWCFHSTEKKTQTQGERGRNSLTNSYINFLNILPLPIIRKRKRRVESKNEWENERK